MKPFGFNVLRKAGALTILLAFILFIDYVGLFGGPNNHFYDLFFRLRGPGNVATDALIVAIDDKTLGELGRWPIRRFHYASLLDRLQDAKTVAFDIIMSEPTGDDAAVEDAIKRHGRVVLAVALGDGMSPIYQVIGSRNSRRGHIHLEQGMDGVVREVYHTLLLRDGYLPSFSSAIFENVAGKTFDRATRGSRTSNHAGGVVQLDSMNINYCGGPGAFERVSMLDILQGVYPASFFKDRICLVGVTATGVGETLLTPFSQQRKGTPGIEIHANVLNTILVGNAIRTVPRLPRWIFLVLIGILCFFLFLNTSELRSTVFMFFVLTIMAAASYASFLFNVWFPPTSFLFTVVAIFVASYALKFNDALLRLDKAYMKVSLHLRLPGDSDIEKSYERGIRGLFTPGGVSTKAQVLGNITDRLVFEKQLTDAAIFSDVQAVLLFGPHGTCVVANGLASDICRENGLDRGSIHTFAEGVTGFIIDKADSGDLVNKLYSSDHRATFSVCLTSPGKKFFKVDASSLLIRGERYLLFVFSDITTLKELEILKDHMISLVSHEIKTPLTSIEGFSELLYDDLEGETKEYASIVQNESRRLIRFLNTFLDISRIEQGRQPIHTAPVIVSTIVHEVAREMKTTAGYKGISIRAETPEEVGPVLIDRDLTKQCLVNLVENAIKYSSPDNSVIIRLRQDADSIRIEVVDHGVGIREGEIGRVFEKFYRSYSADAKQTQGSGLGLTFVKEAVTAQGGSVMVESLYGGGSTFIILFPRKGIGEET